MNDITYELDCTSIELLYDIIGVRCDIKTENSNINFNGNITYCLPPLYFKTNTDLFKMSNDWYMSPQGHDFHLPKFRLEKKKSEIGPRADNVIGLFGGVNLTGRINLITSIEILRFKSQCAIINESGNRDLVPSDEIITYDFGVNIYMLDGTCLSISTEDDSILGEWIISSKPIEPSYEENVWLEKIDIRKTLM